MSETSLEEILNHRRKAANVHRVNAATFSGVRPTPSYAGIRIDLEAWERGGKDKKDES